MAQLTNGLLFQWSADGTTDWKTIPDVTSIPTLIGEPNSHDVTTIYSTQKEYLEGLPDNGGTLSFGILMTPEVLTAVEAIQTAQATKNPFFRVAMPRPLMKAYQWQGTMAIPGNEEWSADNPLTGTLNVTPTSAIEFKEYEPDEGK